MDATKLHWNYNARFNVVESISEKGRDIAVIIPDTLPPQYGPFIARAPQTQLLSKHLFGLLERSNKAWDGEEKSVKRAHRPFIDRMVNDEKLARLFVESRAQHDQIRKLSEMEVPGLPRKKEAPMNWRYDSNDFTVKNTFEREIGIIRGDTVKEKSAIGALVVAAPANFKIAHFLLAKLNESRDEWMNEEESVIDEHYNLLKEMEATILRATAILTGEVKVPVNKSEAVAMAGIFVERDEAFGEGTYRVNLNTPVSGIATAYGEFDLARGDDPYNNRHSALNAALRIIEQHNGTATMQEEVEQEETAPAL